MVKSNRIIVLTPQEMKNAVLAAGRADGSEARAGRAGLATSRMGHQLSQIEPRMNTDEHGWEEPRGQTARWRDRVGWLQARLLRLVPCSQHRCEPTGNRR